MESADNNRGTPTKESFLRRSRKLKNLEHEVDLILSQEESDDDLQPTMHGEEMPLPKTPSTSRKTRKDPRTPRASESVLQDMLQTPRRSCRKSVKPPQDYEDIVKKSSRSVSKSTRKKLSSLSEDNEENQEECAEEQHKWNAANVGRTSSKRSRKSKRSTKGKRQLNDDVNVENIEAVQVKAETVTVNINKLDVDGAINDMESEHNPLNKYEVIETVQADVEKTVREEESDVSEKPNENISDEQPEEEIHLIQEDSLDCVINTDEDETSLKQIAEKKEDATVSVPPEDQIQEESGNFISDKGTTLATAIQQDEDIHLIQEDSEDCMDFTTNSSNSETNSLKEITEEKDTRSVTTTAQPEEEMHLIQEDSEDSKDFTTNSNSKKETTVTELDNTNDDSFGCYLKSKEMDMEDLGLNPIIDDDDVAVDLKKENTKLEATVPQESQEDMPSLIVCDDDDEENESEKTLAESKTPKLNATFDADDSVVVVVEEKNSNSTNTEAVEMDALQLSDDESENSQEPVRKAPRIMLTTEDEQNETLLSTPKRTTKPYRFPTPYRNRSETKLNRNTNTTTGSAKKLPLAKENLNKTTSFTTMTPKEIVLRGIRKRSMSLCLGADELSNSNCITRSAKRNRTHKFPTVQKIVNFYSPANQTAIIEDFDKLIAKSVKKNNTGTEINRNKNVTTRRKRSMSFDESMMSKSLTAISKLPRPVSNQTSFLNSTTTTTSSSLSTSSSKTARTKLPNFAAIHQKQFQKMENLVDHVSRKQERSKILISSTTKIRPASAQKNISVNINNKNSQLQKPKALRKIDMTSQNQTKAKSSNNTAAPPPRKIVPAQKIPTHDTTITVSKLPDPRNMKLINQPKQQPPLPRKHLKPTQTFNVSSMSNSMANSTLKQKPAFNLSTHTGNNTTATKTKATSSTKTSTMTNKQLSTQDKMASRLQRHMDLFKGRVPAARAGVASRKNEAAVLGGVRSNRRFELQMQHRRNIEN